MSQVQYGQRYRDDGGFEYTHVHLKRGTIRDTSRLLTCVEWQDLGVDLPGDWQHYTFHLPEPHILLMRRKLPIALCRDACAQTTNEFSLSTAIGRRDDSAPPKRLRCKTTADVEGAASEIEGQDARAEGQDAQMLRQPRRWLDPLGVAVEAGRPGCVAAAMEHGTAGLDAEAAGDPKAFVICNKCGRQVRKDNLARHKKSSRCTALASDVASSKATITCKFCRRNYFGTQWKRHLASEVCKNARAQGNNPLQSIDID